MSRDTLVSLIDPDPQQPRQHFDESALAELAQSMQANGLIVPVLLRPADDRFVLVHGERRWRAAQLLKWETIPAEVRDVSPEEAPWLALIENVQRADLSPIEEARAYQQRLDQGITQEQLAQRIGKTRTYIAQKVRLLKLPGDVQAALDARSIAEGHARQLLRLKSGDMQSELGSRAVAEGWTVERARLEVDKALTPAALPVDDLTPAQLVRYLHILHQRDGRPNHSPYPEERLPGDHAPPLDVRRLPIAEIVDVPGDDPRGDDRDPAYAEWLAEIFDTLPPIAVFLVGGEYILADGRYRLQAARLLGLHEIECRVYAGETTFDAYVYGVAANCGGGVPVTEKDYRYMLNRDRKRVELIQREALAASRAAPAESDGLAYHEAQIDAALDELRAALAAHLGPDWLTASYSDLWKATDVIDEWTEDREPGQLMATLAEITPEAAVTPAQEGLAYLAALGRAERPPDKSNPLEVAIWAEQRLAYLATAEFPTLLARRNELAIVDICCQMAAGGALNRFKAGEDRVVDRLGLDALANHLTGKSPQMLTVAAKEVWKICPGAVLGPAGLEMPEGAPVEQWLAVDKLLGQMPGA